jgi:hypothetical protein
MTTPRKHYKMMCQLAMDDSLKKWEWQFMAKSWEIASDDWDDRYIFFVGHTKPTQPPKRMCCLGGVTFEAPETVAPAIHTIVYIPRLYGRGVKQMRWLGYSFDAEVLEDGLVHLNPEAATLHSQGLAAVNLAAVKGGA